MKTPHFRLRLSLPSQAVVRRVHATCSVMVLASLGLLAATASPVLAQGAGGTLAPGALPVLRGPAPAGIAVNSSVAGTGNREMTITQQQQRSVISWDSFNIGRSARVQFVQPGPTASVLNRIYGTDPSIIQGQLSANGQVLLINQNGILFDRGAQVNVRSLVASTLNISDARFESGLTSGGLNDPAFAGGYSNTGVTLDARPNGTRPGNVNVGSFGPADAPAPELRAQAGGSIMILAPRVDVDAGLLTAPDGQVMLAAGRKVFLAQDPNAGNAQGLQTGVLVEVEALADGPALNLTNLIRQAGQISADRGNVTLAALAVNQEGRVSSTTAVERGGSVYLQARARDAEGAQTQGSVTLRAGSVTEVVPDLADTSTALEVLPYAPFRGVVRAEGSTIDNHGTLRVPGGVMSLVAANTAAPESARVYLGAGSETSVAGAWSSVPLSRNLATFTVTSNELKNAPDQKTGVLRGAEVTVDLRQGSNILALDGYRDIVPRTVAEKAAVGGELNIGSSGSVIQRSGAVIDASGGGYRYEGGQVNTSRLLGADGRVYDIATAPQAQPYTALLDSITRFDERWGQTITTANPLGAAGRFQPGYTEGKAGGAVVIQATAGLVLDGSLKGGVTIGALQYGAAPAGASLTLGRPLNATPTVLGDGVPLAAVNWRQQATDTLGSSFQPGSSLSNAQRQTSVLAAEQLFGAPTINGTDRVERGFGSVTLNAAGSITLPAEVRLISDPGASLQFNAPLIDLAGDIHLPAGRLALSASLPAANIPAGGSALAENLVVRSGASLSTAGLWINNGGIGGASIGTPTPSARLSADGLSSQPSTDGGTISVSLEADQLQTRYERGALLDVGGGASIDGRGLLVGGRGGLLRLANGAFGQTSSDWLQADLRGFAIGNGARLDLSMSRVEIAADGANRLLPASTTRFGTGLFSNQGFSQVTLRSNNTLDVLAGTSLLMQQKNLLVDPEAARVAATGTELSSFSTVTLLPAHQRNAATLSLASVGGGLQGQGRLTLQEGAAIVADAAGRVSLTAVDGLSVLGRIESPGGSVALTLNGPALRQASDLVIGNKASILVAGTFLPTPSNQGLVLGNLLNGGSVSITAGNAGVQLASGSRIDISAVNQTVDRLSSGSSPELTTRTLEGHAGTMIVRAQGSVSLDGTLLAQGGSARAAGGSFALELLRPDGQPVQPAARRVVVTANGNALAPTPGLVDATVNIAALQDAGFDKLRIQSEDQINLRDNMTLDFERGLRLDAPRIELSDSAQVELRGASVALGQSLGPRVAEPTPPGISWNLFPNAARPVAPTRSGNGNLSVRAGAVDLFGSVTVNGTSLTRIESDSDIRLVGRNIDFASTTGGSAQTRQIGGLSTAGNLELTAAQVVAATRTEFSLTVKDQPTDTLTPGGYILVSNNGKAAGAAYSAGSSLTLQADTIVQGGTVKAPLGSLQLQAGSLLELAPGSVSSVAGEGLTVLYGNTDSGVRWVYDTSASTSGLELNAVTPGGKRITLEGAQVAAQPGSVVNMAGGGDILAVEFIPGNGGDRDITLRDNTFAIIPAARLATMPFDAYTLQLRDPGFGFSPSNGRDAVLYDSITLGEGAGVPPGQYVLLPARYALLPDASLVQINTAATYRNLEAGQTVRLANGDLVVAGFRSARGTTVQESQSVGVVISPGRATALQSSDYDFSGADFFAASATANRQAAPLSPWDAGRMQIGAGTTLSLAGSINTSAGVSAAGRAGRGAQVDVSGTRIAVVGQAGAADLDPRFLQVNAASLSALNASVLLGGTRRDTETGITIATTADEVLVANGTGTGSEVRLPELLISARQRIDIRADSALTATGTQTSTAPSVIQAPDAGALVRLSTGAQARVERGSAADGADARGEVRVAAGASLSAQKSLLIDATRNLESAGSFAVGGVNGVGGSLALASGQVHLGQTTGFATPLGGLVLSNDDLARFSAVDELLLRGSSSINFIGSTLLGAADLASLSLDTPLLRGLPSSAGAQAVANVNASSVQLVNSGPGSAPASTGSGRFELQAKTLTLGEGQRAISGFETVTLAASERVAGAGDGKLQVAAALQVQTPQLLALAGSNQTISAADTAGTTRVHRPLVLSGAAQTVAAAAGNDTALGGQIGLEGQSLTVSTAIVARSGVIGLTAHGNGNGNDSGVTLGAGALLDAAGQSKDFNGNVALADGGRVSVQAGAGTLRVQDDARVTVSAAAAGGAAGQLALQGNELLLEGRLEGQAGAGQRSGTVDIDLGRMAGFSALNTAINSGGFEQERRVRARTGDIAVAATDVVSAARVALSADAGRIDVAGRVGNGAGDSSGNARVTLSAATGLALAAGSEVRAGASAPGARGGEVNLSTTGGALVFGDGATIDVRAGNGGPAGAVGFSVDRETGLGPTGLHLAGTVRRGSADGNTRAAVDVLATRRYNVTDSVSEADISGYAADHATFVAAMDTAAAAAITGRLQDETGSLQGARVLGAVELSSAGSLRLDTAWDLASSSWLADNRHGLLTIRAAGDLTISQSIGLPNDNLLAGDSWGLRLTAGADLSAANPLATLARQTVPQGSLRLTGAEARLRTGTGRIDLAAAGDLRIDNVAATIYTAGRVGVADGSNNRWAVAGGGVSMVAGGDIAWVDASESRDLWVSEWMRRPRLSDAGFNSAGQPTDWWVHRPFFRQGVGTLAGGDIDVRAGGNVNSLTVALPTTGRTVVTEGVRSVDVQGGGDLRVEAGGDIIGGSFLVGRGLARVDAADDLGAQKPIQLYLMGVSSGGVPERAQAELVAGGSISLQNIQNPTALQMVNSAGTGPGFGAQTPATFFSYSANSAASLQSKSGDASFFASLGTVANWRTFGPAVADASFAASLLAAWPANLRIVAFDGDISNLSAANAAPPTTFPSPGASISVLAGRDVNNLSLAVSDLSPAAAPTTISELSRRGSLSGGNLAPTEAQPRIVEREAAGPFVVDIQAAQGSIVFENQRDLPFRPAASSRLQAGVDVVGAALFLQNLDPEDVSVVRASSGDIRNVQRLSIGGPGRLVLQAGRNIDLGDSTVLAPPGFGGNAGISATGNTENSQIGDARSARVTVVAGVTGRVDLAAMESVYADIITINTASADILDLYGQLGTERDSSLVLAATDIAALADRDPVYARFRELDAKAPGALKAYQDALRNNTLPLGPTADSAAAAALYALLNAERDVSRLEAAGSIAALAAGPDGQVFSEFVALGQRYPLLYTDYVQRRSAGAIPTGVTPIVFSNVLNKVVARVLPDGAGAGSITSFQTSIQTYAGSDIDLWAPGGNAVVGLTTPDSSRVVGVLTNAGGAVRSVLSGNLSINQGKVITLQGGDILLFSSQGSIDAGRGARTAVTASGETGSGIQTLTSDPDGLGPLTAPRPGNVFLFAPAGTIDAGEAGIRSSGNIVLNAQTVLNATNISAGGTSAGVPQVQVGTAASALASSPGAPTGSKAAEDAAKAAGEAAKRAATAPPPPKPTILSVEVLGFGENNCKEDDKNCFAR